jgi:hypothetical protein
VLPLNAQHTARVLIDATGFSPGALVQVGLGEAGSQYSILGQIRADSSGAVHAGLAIPPWADPGAEYVVVLDDGGPRALLSPAILIAATGSMVEVAGKIAAAPGGCPGLRSAGGKLYALTVPVWPAIAAETSVRVRGRVAPLSRCGDFTSLDVERLELVR